MTECEHEDTYNIDTGRICAACRHYFPKEGSMKLDHRSIYLMARRQWGDGWIQLSKSQRRAAICEVIVTDIMRMVVAPGSQMEELQISCIAAIQTLDKETE